MTAAPATKISNSDFDDEDWDWNDNGGGNTQQQHQPSQPQQHSSASSQTDELMRLEATTVVEAFVERLLQPLKECSQLFAKMNDDEYASNEVETPRSLVAQLCSAVLDPTKSHIPELEHVSVVVLDVVSSLWG